MENESSSGGTNQSYVGSYVAGGTTYGAGGATLSDAQRETGARTAPPMMTGFTKCVIAGAAGAITGIVSGCVAGAIDANFNMDNK